MHDNAPHTHDYGMHHIEEVENESKEDNPIEFYMDSIFAVDVNITFKDTHNARHTRHILHL
jgi:hypothetical protein